jgi:hypothetical protein
VPETVIVFAEHFSWISWASGAKRDEARGIGRNVTCGLTVLVAIEQAERSEEAE